MSRALLPPDARSLLDYLTLATPPEDLARSLYGPTWREAVRRTPFGFRTVRDPLPGHLADFLADVLSGVIAHDGRSTRDGRTRGWWLRDAASGSWSSTTFDAVGLRLHRDVLDLLDRASAALDEARAKADARKRAARPSEHEREEIDREETRGPALRLAVLSGLSHAIASLGRNLAATLAGLRDRLPLPIEARHTIAREWLYEALDLGDLDPRGDRLLTAEVREVWQEHEASGASVLPLQMLYRALDDLLGPRSRRVAWTLPEVLAEAA